MVKVQAFLTASPNLKRIRADLSVFPEERFAKFVVSAEEAGVEEVQIECSDGMQRALPKIRAQTRWLQLTNVSNITFTE